MPSPWPGSHTVSPDRAPSSLPHLCRRKSPTSSGPAMRDQSTSGTEAVVSLPGSRLCWAHPPPGQCCGQPGPLGALLTTAAPSQRSLAASPHPSLPAPGTRAAPSAACPSSLALRLPAPDPVRSKGQGTTSSKSADSGAADSGLYSLQGFQGWGVYASSGKPPAPL